MEHGTCQFQSIGLWFRPQEVDDGPILHPRRHHGIFLTIHRDTNQLQYVRVRQSLPNYDLSAKVLQMVELYLITAMRRMGQSDLLFLFSGYRPTRNTV